MNRGRHKKKRHEIHLKVTVYDNNLNCHITYYIENGKLKIENAKPRKT